MKLALFLAGVAIGFALRAWDVNHFIGVIAAAMFGFLLATILFVAGVVSIDLERTRESKARHVETEV